MVMMLGRLRRAAWRRRRAQEAVGAAVVLVVFAAACGEGSVTGPPLPPSKETAELSFLIQDAAGPALLTMDTTFVATRGQQLKIELSYEPAAGSGQSEGDEFLEFELDEDSLLRYPPGHPRAGQIFQVGDTITIRILVDPTQLLATLEPSGLQFDPNNPAELEIRYTHADDDFDGDGADDPPEAEAEIDLWRQESPGDRWDRVGEIKDLELDRIRAFLTSFSRYALAI